MKKLLNLIVALAGLAMLFAAGVGYAVASGDAEYGEYLSGQCTTCHQLSGNANGIPAIVGLDEEAFVAVMEAYKTKQLENKVMQNIAGALGDGEIAALAAYFSKLKPDGNE